MNYKKLISLFISGSMLLSSTAFGSEIFDYSVDQENRTLSITYINPDYGKTECSISVTPKDSNIPVYANQTKSDFGGIVKDEIALSQKGWYTVFVKPMGSKDAGTRNFAILDDSDLNNYWDILTRETDYEVILDYWEEISEVFSLSLSEDTRVFVLCGVLAENRNKDFGERNEANLISFKEYLSNEAELLSKLNKCKDVDSYRICELLEESFAFIKSEDEAFFEELTILFETKGEQIAALYADGADSVYTFWQECELLKECVNTVKVSDVLDIINKANHTSIISDIISDSETAKLLGIYDLLDEYLELKSTTIVDKALYSKNFKNIEDFTDAFENAMDKAKDDEKDKDDNQKRLSSGGGGFSSSPVTAPVGLIAADGHPESDAQLAFGDLADYGWAKSAILSLYDRKIISGREEGIFAPGDKVTRAEFSKMLILSLGIIPSNSVTAFSDVLTSDWFAPYVYTANSMGIVKGYGDKFSPNENITREDAAVMICRGLSLSGSVELEFSDSELISDYARGSVSALYDAGIISGMTDGSFAPKSNLTRAEASVMLERLIQKFMSEVN